MLTIGVCNGMGISVLILVHHGKPEPQDSCPCHHFHSSALFQHELTEMEGAFPQLWILPLDAVGNPDSHRTWYRQGSAAPQSGLGLCLICHRGILVDSNINRVLALTVPEAFTGIVFLQRGLRLFILFRSQLSQGEAQLCIASSTTGLCCESCFLSPVLATSVVCKLCPSFPHRGDFFFIFLFPLFLL